MSDTNDDALRVVIHAVRRRWRLKVALRGTAVVAAAGLAALTLSAYAMDHFRYEPWAVTAFRLFAYVTVLALALRFLVLPLSGRVTEDRVALYVEEHEPSLQAAVLSAVDVARKGQRPAEVSPALAERLVADAIEKCQTIDYGRQVERRGLRRASGMLAAAAAAGMAVTLLSPAFLRHAAPFLFTPWHARDTSPYAIDVDPGNATVARGGSQPVSARLRGFESETVDLAVRSEPSADWKRWPMTSDADAHGFRFVLFGLDKASEYFVEASGVRSPSYRLEVADIPYVKRVDLEYRFPAYTGLPPQSRADTGDVAALAGTEVKVRVTPTMKVTGGRLQVEGEEPRVMALAADGTLSATFEVRKDGFYRIALPGRDGTMQPGSPDYTVDLLADQPPTVTLTRPGRDAKVTSIEEVFTEMHAEDDYGVARAELVYSVNGAPEKTVVLHQGPARKSVSAGHTFFLEDLGLQPGDFISYYARAGDESAARQTTTSDIYFMEVRPFEKEYRQAEERGGGGGGGTASGALSYQQRQIVAATFKLARDRGRAADKQYGEDLATLALVQGRLHDQVQSLLQRMASRGVVEPGSGLAKTADSLQAAQAEMVSARAQLQARKAREALPPEQGALKHLQRAEAAFREVQVSFGDKGGSGGASGAGAEELADLFELEMDKLKNQYEAVQRGQQQQADDEKDAALERLRQLAQREEQESERMKRLAGGPPNMAGSGGGAQRQLAEQTEELARRLERLSRESSSPSLQESARQLQDAASAMRRAASGAQGQGAADAKAALDRLQEARRRLEGERTGRLDRDVEQAVRAAEELRQAQDKIASETAGLGTDRGRLDRLLERKDALESQVGALEGQLDRVAREARGGNKDAARKLQEAAEGIRDHKLKEKIRYSKGVVKAGAGEQARQLESDIGSDIGSLRAKLGEAAGAAAGGSAADKRMAALERMRGLTRNLESLEERVKEGDAGGAKAAGAKPGGTQAGGAAGEGGRAEAARQLQRELRERVREADGLARDFGSGPPGGASAASAGSAAHAASALRDVRRLDDARLLGDPKTLAQLLSSVTQGLKSAEFALRREVEGPGRDKVFLSGSQDLPPGWQAMVEEYYRALARKPAAGIR